MTNILPFKRPKPGVKSKGKTLCRNNHHKWAIVKEQQFDVKSGKLVTVEQCSRCQKRRNKLT